MKKNKIKKDEKFSRREELLYNTKAGFFKTLNRWYLETIERAEKSRPKKLSKFLGIFYALLIGWGGWHKIYEGDFLLGITYGSITLMGCSLMVFLNIHIYFLGKFSYFLPALAVESLAIFDAFFILLGFNKKYK